MSIANGQLAACLNRIPTAPLKTGRFEMKPFGNGQSTFGNPEICLLTQGGTTCYECAHRKELMEHALEVVLAYSFGLNR
jgi:hypothetical protein